MKKIFIITTCAAALAISGPLRLNAQQRDNVSPAHERFWNPARLKEKLGLTDEQLAKIKTEIRAQKGPLKEQAQHAQVARANLRHAVQANAPEQEIRTAAATLGAAEGDLAVTRAALFARIAPILTPEQLAKIHDLQDTR